MRQSACQSDITVNFITFLNVVGRIAFLYASIMSNIEKVLLKVSAFLLLSVIGHQERRLEDSMAKT